ncbi:hypothetical protein NFHSH190041_01150 [Shewanella sp. NFH-SH190041]|nr:hypothetical protein NFHSH190041_01150 [Shewanella sp. NFH-SH190041]
MNELSAKIDNKAQNKSTKKAHCISNGLFVSLTRIIRRLAISATLSSALNYMDVMNAENVWNNFLP